MAGRSRNGCAPISVAAVLEGPASIVGRWEHPAHPCNHGTDGTGLAGFALRTMAPAAES